MTKAGCVNDLEVRRDSMATAIVTADEPVTDSGDVVQPRKRMDRFIRSRPVCLAIVSYMAISLYANWPSWPGNPSDYRPGDLTGSIWGLAWISHVILHPQNPFFTNYINYPAGANIAQNSPAPLLGLVTFPLTMLAGPISSLNLLLWLAFPASAASAFYVLRRVGCSRFAAYVGGLLYGFSPYMNGQGIDHLTLCFVPLPPLILFAAYRLLASDRVRPLRTGAALGLLVAAQYYICQEVAVSTIVMLVVAVVVLAITRPKQVPSRIGRALSGLAVGIAIAVAAIAYPVWVSLNGPQHFQGAVGAGLGADLLGSFVPTSLERFVPAAIAKVGNSFVSSDVPENGSYLSIPLVLLALYFVVRYWRDRWIRFAAFMTLVALATSLGAYLTVNAHGTTIPLPAWLLWHTSGLNDLAEVRFSLYEFFFLSVLFALGLDRGLERWRRASSRRHSSRRLGIEFPAVAALLVVGFVFLVPRWPYGTGPANSPTYFSSKAVRSIPSGSTVLISPYPSVAEVAPQLWQAISEFRFRIIGGYVLTRGTGGHVSVMPEVLDPVDLVNYLWNEATSGSAPSTSPKMSVLVHDVHTFVRRYHVSAVISSGYVSNVPAINHLLRRALGRPSYVGGGVLVWNFLSHRLDPSGD